MFTLSQHPESRIVSFQERGSLAGWMKNPNAQLGNSNFAFRTHFRVDQLLLERSVSLACAGHEAPSTRFELNGNGDLQRYFLAPEQARFELQAVSVGESADDPAVAEQVVSFCAVPFRVGSEHWLRVLLIHTAEGSSVIGIRMPHLICDAVSMSLFVADVWKHYEALATGQAAAIATPPFTLRDHAASQQIWAKTDEFTRLFDKRLSDSVAQMQALIAGLPAAPTPRPSRLFLGVESFLPAATQEKFGALARQTKMRPGTLLIACSLVAMSRLYGQRDFCYRLPFSARVSHQFERIVGFLSTDLLMFAHIDGQQNFLQFISHMQRESLAMMRYGALPGSLIRQRLREQVSDALFDEYVVNVIPPLTSLSDNPAFATQPFAVPVFGLTNVLVKVLITTHDKGIRIALRLGAEEEARAQTELLPQFMSTFCALIESPERSLDEALQAGF